MATRKLLEVEGPDGRLVVTEPVSRRLCRPFIVKDGAGWARNLERPFGDILGDLIDLRCLHDGRTRLAIIAGEAAVQPGVPQADVDYILGLIQETLETITARGGGIVPEPEGHGMIVYDRGQESRAVALLAALSMRGGTAIRHVLIGRLLGYPRKDVQAWLVYQRERRGPYRHETEAPFRDAQAWLVAQGYPGVAATV